MQLSSVYSCCGLGELADVQPPQNDEEYKHFSDLFFDLLVSRCSFHRILFMAPHNQYGEDEPCRYDYLVKRMIADGWKLLDEFPRNTMYKQGTIRIMAFDTSPLLPIIKEKQSAKWRQMQEEDNRRHEVAMAERIAAAVRRDERAPEAIAAYEAAQRAFMKAQNAYTAAMNEYARVRNGAR